MAGTSGFGNGARMAAGGALAVVLALAVYITYQKIAGTDVSEPVAVMQPAPQVETPVASKPPEEIAAPTEETAVPSAPSFDVVRVEPDGSSVVAGSASAGADVTILLDGEEVGRATADAQGKFVALLSVPVRDDAQVLSLSTQQSDGTHVVSNDSVILTPASKPAPEPTPDPDVVAISPEIAPADVAPTQTPEQEVTSTQMSGEPASEPEIADAASEAVSADVTSAPTSEQDTTPPTTLAEPTAETPQAPAVLLANEDGVRVLQPADAGPDAMRNVVIDAISYDAGGEVQLSGRGTDSGFVRVYLDNKPVLTTRIEEDGAWRTQLPNVDTGIYTLRVDQVDAAGTVTSRAETPFKRETVEVLESAQGTAPTQQVSAVTVQPGSTLWAIARDTYGDGTLYVRVFEANRDNIRNPDLIYPGQVFAVPE